MKNMMIDWPWLAAKFNTVCLPLFVSIYVITWGFWVLTGKGLLDRSNIPVGGDFSHYWVAATMARAGEAAAVYDISRFTAAQDVIFGIKSQIVWLYPPTFLLVLLPLSFLPYLASFVAWISLTLGGYLLVLRKLAPHPRIIWMVLAFPLTFLNFGYGQNGFLSGVLLGGGLLVVDKFPIAGGTILGLLTYKPHLAVLIPLALIAGKRWLALAAMLASAAALMLASWLAFGNEVWAVFLKNIPFSIHLLETGRITAIGDLPLAKMPTVFTTVMLAGGNLTTALMFQGTTMLLVAVLVAWVWHIEAPLPLRASALVLGICLFTPYDFIYDLALLALPLAWLGWEGYTQGWLPGEKTCLFLGWLAPVPLSLLAKATQMQLTPLVLMALMFLVLRRTVRESPSFSGTLAMVRDKSGTS